MCRKIKYGLFCLVLVVFLSACGVDTPSYGLSKKNPVAIELWHYYNGAQQAAFDTLIAEFNDTVGREKGILVNARAQGGIEDLHKKTVDALHQKVGAQTLPDMVVAYGDTAYLFHERKMAADIRSYLSAEEVESFVPTYLEEGGFAVDGEIQMYPIAKSTEAFLLNASDWEPFAQATGASEEGFQTWEGIVEVAAAYYAYTDGLTPDIPYDGKAFFGRDALDNYMIVGAKQLGVDLFSVANHVTTVSYEKKVLRRLWDNYYVPMVEGWFSATGRFRTDDVKTGQLVACVASTPASAYFPNRVTREDGSVYDIDCKVYPVPNFAGTEPMAIQQGAGVLVVKGEEKREYASILFLDWFTQPEPSLKFCLNSGYLPVKQSYNSTQAVAEEYERIHGNTKQELSSPLCQAVLQGIDMTSSYTFYTNHAFYQASQIRANFKHSMEQEAHRALDEIDAQVKLGQARELAIAQQITDEAFALWYETLCRETQEILEAPF